MKANHSFVKTVIKISILSMLIAGKSYVVDSEDSGDSEGSFESVDLSGEDNNSYEETVYDTGHTVEFWNEDEEDESASDDGSADDGSSDDETNLKAETKEQAGEIISLIPSGADTWEKAKIIHDELIRRLTYDHSFAKEDIRSVNCLATGDAVCLGYAEAFRYVMEACGEEARVVISDDGTHAWNYVSDGGKDGYIDVTWDDSDNTDDYGNAMIKYDYFFVTSDELELIGSHGLADTSFENTESYGYNYYDHNQLQVQGFDWNTVEGKLAQQYGQGDVLTISFYDAEGYWDMCCLMNNDCEQLSKMLGEIGYYGKYWYDCNDELSTFTIWLE